MKRSFIFAIFVLALLITPFISAEIIINQQPNKVYNLGDSVTVPISIFATSTISDDIHMDLLCGGKVVPFCQNGVDLGAGTGKNLECYLVLNKDKIGETTGNCKISVYLSKQKGTAIATDDFKISNSLTLNPNTEQTAFNPGESILVYGDATKDNGQPANGFIDMAIAVDNSSGGITQRGTVNAGIYSMNITLPEKMRAGKYLVTLNAYEVTADNSKTNKGFINYNIVVKQVPTSLELLFENNKIEPGNSVKVKAILHDQTGEPIDSTAIITIKRGTTEIVEGGGPTEKSTGDYMTLPIAYNEAPSNWTVFAISNQLTTETHFVVLENKEIKAEMINDTLVITNIGNVPYNDTIIIKIGNTSEPFNLSLGVDENKKIVLNAAEGDHDIEVMDENGESKLKDTITITKSRLTGNAIQIRDASVIGIGGFFTRPIVWVFIGLILLGIIFVILRRRKKKNQYGSEKTGSTNIGGGLFKKKINQQSEVKNIPWENRAMPLSKESKLQTKNKANLSLSIKGNKQDISIVNVTIRNLAEVQEKKGNPEEPLQKIIYTAENKKAFVYENQNNLFFILTPSKTRTFKNEDAALEIAQTAKEVLLAHNKIAKYRLDFGISIEYGSIVEKTENGVMEFMSLGTLMSNAKKIASASQGEVLLGEKIKEKLINVRTEKQDNGRIVFYKIKDVIYKIKDIKYHDEEHSKFLKNFVKNNESNFGRATTSNQTTSANKSSPSPANTGNDAQSTDPKSLIKGFY
jgi:hypothetical protein